MTRATSALSRPNERHAHLVLIVLRVRRLQFSVRPDLSARLAPRALFCVILVHIAQPVSQCRQPARTDITALVTVYQRKFSVLQGTFAGKMLSQSLNARRDTIALQAPLPRLYAWLDTFAQTRPLKCRAALGRTVPLEPLRRSLAHLDITLLRSPRSRQDALLVITAKVLLLPFLAL